MAERGKGSGATVALLAALGLALALAGPGGRAPENGAEQGPVPSLDPERLAEISVRSTPAVARAVAGIRGLEFDRVPEPEVVTSDYLNRLGAREAKRGRAEAALAAGEAEARIAGLLASDEQLEALYTATGDLAAAAYDTRRDRLYVVSDAVAANRSLVEFVLAHELGHALEDERFGLPEDGASDDAALAETALVEGSATAVMVEYAATELSYAELVAASSGIDAGTGAVPQFALDQLLWTYLGGQRFVDELRALAGGDWKLVDYALEARPPATTEQVMHPRKYVREERPQVVRVRSAALEAGGWRLVHGGVQGEFATAQLLEVGAAPALASRAARGWGGDTYELWRRDTAAAGCEHPCRADLVLALGWRWDRDRDAGEFARAMRAYAEDGLGGVAESENVWAIDGGALALAGGARTSALVFAPTARLAREVAVEQVEPAPGRIAR